MTGPHLDDQDAAAVPAAPPMPGGIDLDDLPAGDPAAAAHPADLLPPEPEAAPLTAADLAEIEAIEGRVLSVVARANSARLPVELRESFTARMESDEFTKWGVELSGIGPALHELMPKPGNGAAGPVKKLHPLLRVALGLVVLVVSAEAHRRGTLATHQPHAPTGDGAGRPAAAAGGGWNVSSYGGAQHDV